VSVSHGVFCVTLPTAAGHGYRQKHLNQLPDEYAELADVILVVENVRLQAHSQILAMHSNFVRKLLLETGPRSWQDPGHASNATQLPWSSCS